MWRTLTPDLAPGAGVAAGTLNDPMPPKPGRDGRLVVASNRRARHDYTVLDTVEAGISLRGSEVKSLREGKAQLADAYARVEHGEVWLYGVHIPAYSYAHGVGAHRPDERRKLLLHRAEIDKLGQRVAVERLTLVPTAIYFKEGRAKVELALAKGRRHEDRRQAMAERDAKMDIERALGRNRKETGRAF